jgi:PKD domain
MLIALVIGALAATAGDAAAAGWLEPQDISAANEVVEGRPRVAVDPAGNAVAIWERRVGGEQIVEVTERPAGDEWSAPEVLSLPGEEGERSEVTIDAAGEAIAVWLTGESSPNYVIRSAVHPPGGEWSEPEDVSDSIAAAGKPRLAIDSASEAVAVWTAFKSGDIVVQGAIRSADGAWSEADDLSEAGQSVTPLETPDVAIDAAGNAIAVWKLESSDDIVQAAMRPAGQQDWAVPDDLSDSGQDADQPAVAMDNAGDAVAVWARTTGTDTIQGAVRPAGGAWGEPDDLSSSAQNAAEPDVAIDETGDSVAVWTRFDGSKDIVQGAVRPAGGEWAEPEDLSASGQNGTAPVVAANDAVGSVAMWERSDGANLRVQAAVRPPGGEWFKPDTISAAGEPAGFPDVALDAAGDGIAVFGHNGADGPRVAATGYDFAAPLLSGLRIPASATVGERVTFAVSAFDVFPFTTSWNLGDGTPSVEGDSVSHVYTASGAYPVTVSAIDGGGNASAELGAIAIVTASKPPPRHRRIGLTLRIKKVSLRKLKRTGLLHVHASVDETASIALNGRARIRVRRVRGRTRTRLVSAFAAKTVRLGGGTHRKVALTLTKRGRTALRSRSRVRILIAGNARNAAGETATKTARRTLR